METKQIKIYLGTDKKPYSDEERTKLFPQVSDQTFVGENNVSLVEFDLSLLSSFATAIAVIKKPDGEISYQILTQKEIEGKEFYELSLTNYYTNQKGALIIAVELYEAGVVITTIGGIQYIELNGNERILKSESIKLYINYAPFLLPTNEELTSSDLQNILFAISSRVPKTTKINGKELSQDISLVASDIPLDDKNVEIAIDELKDENISLSGEITKILNGSTVVKKAQQDDEGQPIKTTYVKHSQVVNSLLESTTDNPLSALQGKLLNEKILTIQDILESVDTDLDTIQDWVNTQLTTKQSTSEKGQPSGYASLDSGGKVPTAQLPSYVDDVLEYANLSNFPATGMSGIIYVALDTNLTYRWGGSAYIEISPSLALGETDATAYRGDRGKIAYDHSQMTSGNPHNTTKAMIGLGNVDNTSDLNKPISIATQNALTKKADKLVLTNLVENGDLTIAKPSPNENQPLGFNYYNATDISLTNGIAKFTPTAQYGSFSTTDKKTGIVGHTYYTYVYFKSENRNAYFVRYGYDRDMTIIHSGNDEFQFGSKTGIKTSTNDRFEVLTNLTSNFTPVYVDYTGLIDLTATFGAGNEPTKEQMDRIIQAKGFFQTTDITIKDLFNDKADKLVLTNLVSNGDLLTPKASPNENQPLGFNYYNATDISLTNGIAKFTSTQQFGRLVYLIPTTNTTDIIYVFSRYKADNSLVRLEFSGASLNHLGNDNFEYLSMIRPASQSGGFVVSDHRTSDWTPIEVDYMGAINLTATFGAGNEPTKEQMDSIMTLKGYFDTTTIDLKDLMLLGFPQEMVDYVKESKTLIDELTDNTVALVNITWSNLKALRDGAQLVPGRQYRITDYATTTAQQDTQSAGHTFDLIVVADSVNKLNEQARAIQHAEDTYFANSKLEAWQVWYSLDNDTTRFAWADTVNGKGVIYRMIDEFNNDCPYDFKNIKFIRKITEGEYDPDGIDELVYTFTWVNEDDEIEDLSLIGNSLLNDEGYISGVFDNRISETSAYSKQIGEGNNVFALGDNVFIASYAIDSGFSYGCYGNKFDVNCFGNTFGNYVSNNTFGNDVYGNSFGNDVGNNSFGNYVNSNSFGNSVSDNSFGNSVSDNSFGNDVYGNSFGNYVNSNSFGNSVNSNSFGNSVYNNSFGNYVNSNSFGNNVYSNTFGNDVGNNTFGNDVGSNTFGDGCNSNTFGNNCYYLKISENAGSKKYLNIDNGLQGASSVNQLELYDSAIADKSYRISFKKASSGRYLMLWATDTGAMTGKYKALNTDLTWTDL